MEANICLVIMALKISYLRFFWSKELDPVMILFFKYVKNCSYTCYNKHGFKEFLEISAPYILFPLSLIFYIVIIITFIFLSFCFYGWYKFLLHALVYHDFKKINTFFRFLHKKLHPVIYYSYYYCFVFMGMALMNFMHFLDCYIQWFLLLLLFFSW